MATYTVIYDACVLYPAPLRDFLMQLATTGLYRARWSHTIHEEWIGSLLAQRPDLDRAKLTRTRDLMDAHVLDALVTGFETLIDGLILPDPSDRHVLAAAIRSGASAIITYNLGDFPAEYLASFDLEAIHPDDFITYQFDLAPEKVALAARRQRASLTNPPKSVEEFLLILAKQRLPNTVECLRRFRELI